MATNREQFTDWRKSSLSGDDKDCVEAGRGVGVVGVADTKLPERVLVVERCDWAEFLAAVKLDLRQPADVSRLA
ncbi:DUF397 domain-containing protein [Actinomadura oligospora]|uniref:DUF397 domain-containing protein n=1 Tax=Actinomadura oligospora TaxID=111804 RepID=UPI0004BB722A|nr:DUF397 domain-containing protein [Actinomadura oligospora]